MFRWLTSLLTGPSRDRMGNARSSKWAKVRAMHLVAHPRCEVCGTAEEVIPHHIKPFHLYPSLELDPANLLSLCAKYDHHRLYGHGLDWRAWNPEVEGDVAIAHAMVLERQYGRAEPITH